MNNNNDRFFQESNTQCVLSYELLCLLHWLAEHDSEKLKKIISKALAGGLLQDIQKINTHNATLTDNMQSSIVDFFNLLESLLLEGMHTLIEQKAKEKNLMPSIDQIDTNMLDTATVQSSVEKATTQIDKNPHENPKELLLKELLKNWKPDNKITTN